MRSVLLSLVILFSIPAHSSLFWETEPVKEKSNELTPKKIEREGLPDISPNKFSAYKGYSLENLLQSPVSVLSFRKPLNFDYEFVLLLERGKLKRAFVASSAAPKYEPITGIYKLIVPELNKKPWPWRVSIKYENSPMYWALQIRGGYFIHSSPHYGNLGRPASKGCIRTSIPDAMEMFDLVANRYSSTPSLIGIFEKTKLGDGSQGDRALSWVLTENQISVEELNLALLKSRKEIEAVSTGDLEFAPGKPADSHVRALNNLNQKTFAYPNCQDVDCWSFHKKPLTRIRLKPYQAYQNPTYTEYVSPLTPAAITGKTTYNLNEITQRQLTGLDPFLIREIKVAATTEKTAFNARICDSISLKCSKVRTIPELSSGELRYPMYQISEKLSSSESLILDIKTGSGTLNSILTSYYSDLN